MHCETKQHRWAALAAAILAAAGLRGAAVPAEEAPASDQGVVAPLVPGAVAAQGPGGWIAREAAAQRALQLGFAPTAEALLQELLDSSETPAGARNRLVLALAGAYLDEGRMADAEQALGRYAGLKGASWHLRAGLIAAHRRQADAARAQASQVKPEELPAAERGWAHFLNGMIADLAGDFARRNQAFEEAVKSAVSEMQRTRFQLEQMRVTLLESPTTEQEAGRLKQNMERLQGEKPGHAYARYYAIALNALNRRSEAIALLQRQLQYLPQEEKQEQDDMRLLLGLIAGGDNGLGRNALFGLLDRAVSREPQRLALLLLAQASENGAARAEFRAKLDQLIAAPAAHPILEDLLVNRAQLALREQSYGRAEEDAKTLLERFPGSQLKVQALGVLTGVAWEGRRYRTAADYAVKLRAELPAGDARAQVGVLVADADFRAGDYKNAADAYASAQRELPAGIEPGVLLFQQVLAEIRSSRLDASRLDAAQALLDSAAAGSAIDPERRWEAEWNLARALQVQNQVRPALLRVTRLVQEPGAAARRQDLYVRMAWLQARLSLEAGAPADAIRLADALLARLGAAEAQSLPAALRTDVASTSVLLKAQALLESGKTRPAAAGEGLDLLKRLRADYPKTDAAVYSFITEADYYAARYEVNEAQSLFTKLADTYPDNKVYAPFALYEAALNAERRGQDNFYEDANALIERLITTYPESELVFYARLKQGDLLRKLNRFSLAQGSYQWLEIHFPQHRDILLAQLALADCHYALASSDPSHWESAAAIYERLQDLPAAPVDLRIEAGFKHGNAQAKRSHADRAQAAWMLAIDTFLLDPARAPQLGAQGRYWMSRTLLELGDLYEKQGKLEPARRAYGLLISQRLPGEGLARQRLARFSAGAPEGEARR